jgi:hypothetical protein
MIHSSKTSGYSSEKKNPEALKVQDEVEHFEY